MKLFEDLCGAPGWMSSTSTSPGCPDASALLSSALLASELREGKGGGGGGVGGRRLRGVGYTRRARLPVSAVAIAGG